MDRRTFIRTAAFATLAAGRLSSAVAADAPLQTAFAPNPANGWRSFEVTTRVEVLQPEGVSRAWIPLPSVTEAAWIRPQGNLWQGNAASVRIDKDFMWGAQILVAEWEAGEKAPVLEVTSRFSTRDRLVDLSQPGPMLALDKSSFHRYTQATAMLPTDGIVKKTALEITKGAKTDLEKARALYEWIVENTQRNPKTRGCGTGDIKGMLETGNLSGKCADLNALYVGLARSLGMPARDVYGIRVANSRFGYKSLGKAEDITKAQHCRAEVWLTGLGWVPVDPADVRNVVLEEKPGLTLKDDVVVAARAQLFGAWEMNWLAYNNGHDLLLPGSKGPRVPFLMYPQVETAAGRADSLDADSVRYRISSKELISA